MHLDRALQRQILERLREVYPQVIEDSEAEALFPDVDAYQRNLAYLCELELVAAHDTSAGGGIGFRLGFPKITAKGLDFLEDDGGLGAILGVVTVKLHAETIRDLLANRIEAALVPPDQKATLLARLKGLSVQAMEKLALRLVDAGADRGWEFLRGVIDQAV